MIRGIQVRLFSGRQPTIKCYIFNCEISSRYFSRFLVCKLFRVKVLFLDILVKRLGQIVDLCAI